MLESTVDPSFPIGKFVPPTAFTPELLLEAIGAIAAMPARLREAVGGLSSEQMQTPYREGGWTVLQLVNHVGDSHATALHRYKRALTEDWPEIHGYKQELFATLVDATAPAEWSLAIIENVHKHWVMLLQAMDDAAFARGYRHSEGGPQTLDHVTQLYAWHSKHHVAHIMHLRLAKGW